MPRRGRKQSEDEAEEEITPQKTETKGEIKKRRKTDGNEKDLPNDLGRQSSILELFASSQQKVPVTGEKGGVQEEKKEDANMNEDENPRHKLEAAKCDDASNQQKEKPRSDDDEDEEFDPDIILAKLKKAVSKGEELKKRDNLNKIMQKGSEEYLATSKTKEEREEIAKEAFKDLTPPSTVLNDIKKKNKTTPTSHDRKMARSTLLNAQLLIGSPKKKKLDKEKHETEVSETQDALDRMQGDGDTDIATPPLNCIPFECDKEYLQSYLGEGESKNPAALKATCRFARQIFPVLSERFLVDPGLEFALIQEMLMLDDSLQASKCDCSLGKMMTSVAESQVAAAENCFDILIRVRRRAGKGKSSVDNRLHTIVIAMGAVGFEVGYREPKKSNHNDDDVLPDVTPQQMQRVFLLLRLCHHELEEATEQAQNDGITTKGDNQTWMLLRMVTSACVRILLDWRVSAAWPQAREVIALLYRTATFFVSESASSILAETVWLEKENEDAAPGASVILHHRQLADLLTRLPQARPEERMHTTALGRRALSFLMGEPQLLAKIWKGNANTDIALAHTIVALVMVVSAAADNHDRQIYLQGLDVLDQEIPNLQRNISIAHLKERVLSGKSMITSLLPTGTKHK